MKQKFTVTGMTCSACSAHVDKAVRKLDGVCEVNVNLLGGSMTVDWDGGLTPEQIVSAVEKAGYGASLPAAPGQGAAQAQGKRVKLTFYEPDGMPVIHDWCVIQDFDGNWARVEVVLNQKKPEKDEVRLIPLAAISTVTYLKDGEAARRSPLELN